MLELIAANPLWFWLSLGGVLLAAEMLGAGGYLLWSGVAALLVGALIWLLPPLSWAWQGMIFAVLTPTCGGTGCAGARRPHPADRRCSTSATAS